jgi:poly(A) polymerase
MAFLGIPGGPLVGEARNFLMELRLDEGELGAEEAFRRLQAWADAKGLEVAGTKVPPKEKKAE